MRTLCSLLVLFLLPSLTLAQSADTLEAADDEFSIFFGRVVSEAAPGLLANDTVTGNDSLVAVLVDDAMNGTVTLDPTGAFTYAPDESFIGVDSFTYRLATVPLQMLEADTSASSLRFNMRVDIGFPLGSARDSVDSRIGGDMHLYLNPSMAPFTDAHLYDMNLSIVDSLDMEFNFAFNSDLFVSADSGGFGLFLSERGPPATVTDSSFLQVENKVTVVGKVDLAGTGLIGGQVPDDPQEFDTETGVELEGKIVESDTSLALLMPVHIDEEFELGGQDVDMTVSGSILARGELISPTYSNTATVTVTVLVNTDTFDERPAAYVLAQNYPNPFNPSTTIAFSLARGEWVTLKVYDALGREVANLVDGVLPPGEHETQFDAGHLPSGVYIYQLVAEGYSATKRLVLLK